MKPHFLYREVFGRFSSITRKNSKKAFSAFLCAIIICAELLLSPGSALAGNMEAGSYAWGENVGWINFSPSLSAGVTVTDTAVTGYAWGENIGWVNLSPANGGVVNDGSGNLSGYAWGENVGWISFSCADSGTCDTAQYGVTIDQMTGEFSGYAWGENIGWISFSDDDPVAYGVTTTWRGDTDGDGIPDNWEIGYFGNLTHDGTVDTDSDTLTDLEEYQNGSDPTLADTDGDGLDDAAEINTYLTNPDGEDTDNDGLTDYEEVVTYPTDPLDADSDGDFMIDGWEVTFNGVLNPDPMIADDGEDPDGDGFTNGREYQDQTAPNNSGDHLTLPDVSSG